MDERTIRGLRESAPAAWGALYDAFAGRVWQGVARLVGPRPADVADIVQETMLAAARSARGFDEKLGTLWTWLWGIARLQIALYYRKQNRHDRLRQREHLARWLENHDKSESDPIETAELATAVRAVLCELPGDYEALLTAKYLDGDSILQIAEREKSTEMAVRLKLARAREAFRKAFESVNDVEVCHEHS